MDLQVIKEVITENFEENEIKIPKDIPENALAIAFSKYIEADYYEWLKDNFKSFFNYYNPDWDWIRKKIEE